MTDKCSATGFFCEMRMGDSCTLGSPCPHQKPMTNEEWLKQCTTEQLAEWMVMLQLVGVYPIKRGSIDTEMFIADTVEWLKQPHNGE